MPTRHPCSRDLASACTWLSFKQPLRKLLEHQGVAGRGKMHVAYDVIALIPIFIGLFCCHEGRKQVDEGLAPVDTKVTPEAHLRAVATAMLKLLRPGVNNACDCSPKISDKKFLVAGEGFEPPT